MESFKLNLQLEASDDDIAKIKMVANAGSVMSFGSKRYAIDVEGVFPHAESIPIVYGHDCPLESVIRPRLKPRTANYLSRA